MLGQDGREKAEEGGDAGAIEGVVGGHGIGIGVVGAHVEDHDDRAERPLRQALLDEIDVVPHRCMKHPHISQPAEIDSAEAAQEDGRAATRDSGLTARPVPRERIVVRVTVVPAREQRIRAVLIPPPRLSGPGVRGGRGLGRSCFGV